MTSNASRAALCSWSNTSWKYHFVTESSFRLVASSQRSRTLFMSILRLAFSVRPASAFSFTILSATYVGMHAFFSWLDPWVSSRRRSWLLFGSPDRLGSVPHTQVVDGWKPAPPIGLFRLSFD